MTYLRKNGLTPFTELSNQLNVEKGSLSRAINTLVEMKFVDVVCNPNDKRQKSYALTMCGVNRLASADNSANNELSELFGLMTCEESETVIQGLRALRLSAFRKNATHNKARVQIEQLRPEYKIEVDDLILDIFTGEQNIPSHLVPLNVDIPQQWWVARSGEYVVGAVACWQENEKWHWGRFAVDSRFRGLGIGGALALHSLEYLFHNTDEIMTDARDATIHILTDLGGEIIGDRVDFYGMPVTPMRILKQQFQSMGELKAVLEL
ncbi:bifunctional helix-turn-helix transcriptional regulator/GNAT family N-acetyltransferase [Vibrio taketomensis]|uniref:bifunctional helix-turn-helix transcriptional regulator/GNAT family N-acetyltransferase n=1 Tax=Vibrio taketomensis TaxID=2572923 RepID=UPI001E2A1A52|nr:bifunctional helix-turn-helix transcriptional regulator/GNAT family N-acetyltransferase [Vibrio taketomensis]